MKGFMERRNFLKIAAATGASVALESCGNPDHQLIRFVPEEDLVPGVATWKPSVCTFCPAGCGLLVRVMEGEAEVMRNGQLGILRMGLAKKLEGNPAHPVNQGKLCPRGQAGLQVTYHPDRIANPLTRTGSRGSGQFKEITWDDAIKQLVSQLKALQGNKQESALSFVTSIVRGSRNDLLREFSSAFKASPVVEFAFLDNSVLREANARSFGISAVPTVDIGHSNYVISFGADFLGTWNSPVAQSVAYGQMRQGRPGQRGKLVQIEPRVSQTGANADEWIAIKPGTEGVFALAIASVILNEKLRPPAAAGHAGSLIAGFSDGLSDYTPGKTAAQTGVPAEKVERLAREAAANAPAVALIGDVATAQTNGLFNALAVNALNALLGSVGKPGGLLFTAQAQPTKPAAARSGAPAMESVHDLAQRIASHADSVKVLLLDGANPVFATPPDWRVREAFEKVPFIASFGSFVDETSALADLILPDHSPLESWVDVVPASGSAKIVVSMAPPAMNPIHNTRSMPDVLLDVAQQLGGDVAKALPWKNHEAMLQASFANLYKESGSKSAKDADEFWKNARTNGGWWSADEHISSVSAGGGATPAVKASAPQFHGSAGDYPFHFLPFASQMFYDGSLAHLPWMQEAPDPLSTVMWGTWVEINPDTAQKMSIKQGDILEVASAHGKLQTPALIMPGIGPDTIGMPIGQGHENFTRYATGRGANPISILGPATVADTNSLAWASTRVKITRVGEGKIILFGANLNENPPEIMHR